MRLGLTRGLGLGLDDYPKVSLKLLPVQVLALVYALIVVCSRVTDNKHHVGDVVAGAIMGAFLAILSIIRVRENQR